MITIEWGQITKFDANGVSFIKLKDKSVIPFTADKIQEIHTTDDGKVGTTDDGKVGRFVEIATDDNQQIIWVKI